MLLTLSASALRSLLMPQGKAKRPKMDLLDLPTFARQTLNLHGLSLSTDLLAGADRSRLEALRERADKAGAAVLLLSETSAQPFGTSPADAEAAAERTRRVIEAGQILGASAVSLPLQAKDDPKVMELVAERLKKVMERAERMDMNVLIAPSTGLTATPDKVTDLIKKVGGFRIGTFPDFQTAAAASDPLAYLRRLTPYATAVCASTVKFADKPEEIAPPVKRPAGGAAGAGLGKLEELLAKVVGGKPPAADEEEDEEDLSALEADLAADDDDDDEEAGPILVPRHEAYDLRAMVLAVASVGYDGPLSIDYRGSGDVTLGIERSRDALAAALVHAAESAKE